MINNLSRLAIQQGTLVYNFITVVYDEYLVKGQTAKSFFWFLSQLEAVIALFGMLVSSKILVHQAYPWTLARLSSYKLVRIYSGVSGYMNVSTAPRSGASSLVAKRLVAKGCGVKWVLVEIADVVPDLRRNS